MALAQALAISAPPIDEELRPSPAIQRLTMCRVGRHQWIAYDLTGTPAAAFAQIPIIGTICRICADPGPSTL